MHIVVLGAGAIGGTVAACLTRAGRRVTAVTGNETIAAAIAEHGYRVRELDGTSWSVAASAAPVAALAAVDDAGGGGGGGGYGHGYGYGYGHGHGHGGRGFSACILATQSTRMLAAVDSVLPLLEPGAPIVCMQNGLPEDRVVAHLAARGADARVVGCVVGWAASMHEPGLYVRTSSGGFTIGHPGDAAVGGPSGRADLDAVAALLEPAAAVRRSDDLAGVRWSKLAINCCSTTLGVVGGDSLGALLRHRFVRRLALEVFAEVAAVAKASGVRMAPVGGTLDIERVAITPGERALRLGSPSLLMKHSLLLAVGWKFRRLRSSMLYALERGRPPEIDFLNAEVVERGARLGVPTPVNAALVDEVRALFAKERSPGVETLRGVFLRTVEALAAGGGDGGERKSA